MFVSYKIYLSVGPSKLQGASTVDGHQIKRIGVVLPRCHRAGYVQFGIICSLSLQSSSSIITPTRSYPEALGRPSLAGVHVTRQQVLYYLTSSCRVVHYCWTSPLNSTTTSRPEVFTWSLCILLIY